MNICVLVGLNIRKTRKNAGFSQEELAHRAGLDRSYLSEVENGYKNIGIATLQQIADALDIKLTTLIAAPKS